ncbi:MAG: amidophosphoribosyltransferase [SAR202 cluster bacterium]|nr:amidophosphoribosyltransferase [SAR202 cluster bacterium]
MHARSAPREACGVIGIYLPNSDPSRPDAAMAAYHGLFALQHRGQESAGIAAGDGRTLRNFTHMGLVSQAFRKEDLDALRGHIAIGHTRYSTTGSSKLANAQPIVSKGPDVELALGHNGNIINAAELRDRLKAEWDITCTASTDSEPIAHLLSHAPGRTWGERSAYLMRMLKGAYSLVVATKDTLIAIRDPLGVRPMCLGRLYGGWAIASESAALDHMGAQFVREVEAGETIVIDRNGLTSIPSPVKTSRTAHCVFEHIYFARPDSILDGQLTYVSRQAMGRLLAQEHPAEADIVIPVPDSANTAAVGYAQALGIPYGYGLMKNRYVGRTFIEPDQRFRDLGVRNKFNTMPEVLSGKRVVVVDDSIVRGTTTPHIVALLRRAGAVEVHMRICAPPILHPCHFGVDMPTKGEFIANGRTIEQIREKIGADSLGYLSVAGLRQAVNLEVDSSRGFCEACFTGLYPMEVQLQLDKLHLEQPAAPAAE